MIEFKLKDLHVWANDFNKIALPRLEEEMDHWLQDTGVVQYALMWKTSPDQVKVCMTRFDTHIFFYNDRDGLLFKLRFFDHIVK